MKIFHFSIMWIGFEIYLIQITEVFLYMAQKWVSLHVLMQKKFSHSLDIEFLVGNLLQFLLKYYPFNFCIFFPAWDGLFGVNLIVNLCKINVFS